MPVQDPNAPVLVVDDEEMILSAVTRSLGKVGFVTVVTGTAEQALELLQKQSFSCALTDLKMPGMGGHAFLRRCRELAPSLPVIVMSGHGDLDDVIEALRQGASDYLKKPWAETELRQAVRRLAAREGAAAADGLLPKPLPAPTATAAESPPVRAALTFESLMHALQSGEIPLPSAPQIAMEARNLATSEYGSAQAMKELIERDATLTARVLRLSNSSYYARYGTSNTLQTAIARVGFREIGHLVDALIAKQFYAATHPELQRVISELWQRSWSRSIAMRMVAQQHPDLMVNPDRAYLAGLLCDIAFPVLIKVASEQMGGVPGEELLAFAHKYHPAVGASILEAWQLPEECVQLSRDHHMAPESLIGMAPMLLLYWASEELCRDLSDVQTLPSPRSLQALEVLRLNRNQRDLVRMRTKSFVEAHRLES